MQFVYRSIFVASVSLALASCQSSRSITPGAVPPADDTLAGLATGGTKFANPFPDYVVGPRDELSVKVFREPDLSLEKVRVDSSGRFEMPLIGRIEASGKTPDQLSSEIEQRYYGRFLRDPNITVNVTTVNSKRVAVEGAVNKSGVFALDGETDLITTIALAGGPLQEAKLSEVAVFREIDGQSHVAVFDFSRVRSGESANPEILPGDIVVVGFSGLKQAFQEFLRTAPLLGVFTRF